MAPNQNFSTIDDFTFIAHFNHQLVHALPLFALASLVALGDVDEVLEGTVAYLLHLLKSCFEQTI